METHRPLVRSLILLGGHSSRMGSPKYLLSMPSEVSETGTDTPLLIHSLWLHHIFLVKHSDPLLRKVTLSVRDVIQRTELSTLLSDYENDLPADLGISYVQDDSTIAGPFAGLIAANKLDSNAHWLVVGTNYPLVTRAAIEELWKRHQEGRRAVTCFIDSEKRTHPLLSLWTPAALAFLEEEMDKNKGASLTTVIEALRKQNKEKDIDKGSYSYGILEVEPSVQRWIISADTQKEWESVEKLISQEFAENDPHGSD